MKISVLAIGRLKAGPERDLVDDYVKRFRVAGRGLGFRDLFEIEVDGGGGLDAEAARLVAKLPAEAVALRLDEHGEQAGSEAFAARLAAWRDDGVRDLAFLIGGAEGFGAAARAAAPSALAFGVQTWPHRLVRVLLAEQLYRAASILAGAPYHKA